PEESTEPDTPRPESPPGTPATPATPATPGEPGAPSTPAARRSALITQPRVLLAVGVLLLVGAAGLYLWSVRPRLSETAVRDVIYSTIQRESPASFLITGTLEVTATTRVANTRTLLPGVMGIDLGTTSATVRVPGRVSYGFDVREITQDMIRVLPGDTIEVTVPEPSVFSVEPNLVQMEVETQRGWLRLSQATTDDVRGRAIQLVQQALRAQGEAHLRDSSQPGINTADAMYDMLRPALVAAGIDDPIIRFRIGRLQLQRRD
ncbi:MAG: DUF4230 domain-containing protein, partial [Gemmatimonadetes bacterium]|nr:DUF4230 domain-containing protein [Gemmatimonadota bacterium]